MINKINTYRYHQNKSNTNKYEYVILVYAQGTIVVVENGRKLIDGKCMEYLGITWGYNTHQQLLKQPRKSKNCNVICNGIY